MVFVGAEGRVWKVEQLGYSKWKWRNEAEELKRSHIHRSISFARKDGSTTKWLPKNLYFIISHVNWMKRFSHEWKSTHENDFTITFLFLHPVIYWLGFHPFASSNYLFQSVNIYIYIYIIYIYNIYIYIYIYQHFCTRRMWDKVYF